MLRNPMNITVFDTEEREEVKADEELDVAPVCESDLEAIQRAKSDPEAFGVLYERYVTAIYRYAYYRIGDVQDAEDLTARVFVRALKHIHNYDERGVPFAAWLYRIAHNLVVNFHRDAARKPAVSLDEAGDSDEALAGVLRTDDAHEHDRVIDMQKEQAQLAKAIRALSEERQQLIVLKFVEQMSNADIGQIMSRSEGAVKSLYHRTLIQLRELIENFEDAEGRTSHDRTYTR
ncbi:MAG TPA: sigma-70 family RNA polymerase sigma factor [Thermoflexales bacterium]|nr:sigma-70 family RNA polymerase sigma factor [Thermoflexales bacterium]HQW34945.1 sigma-70 family RNA polymerase sigma factor [Thermoflexales bacterium]HQZ99805.1 sigma-70 family RNA polymerase sigma factor [Thermoflexales bacterium]